MDRIAKVINWIVVALMVLWMDIGKALELSVSKLGRYPLKLQLGVQNWKDGGGGGPGGTVDGNWERNETP